MMCEDLSIYEKGVCYIKNCSHVRKVQMDVNTTTQDQRKRFPLLSRDKKERILYWQSEIPALRRDSLKEFLQFLLLNLNQYIEPKILRKYLKIERSS